MSQFKNVTYNNIVIEAVSTTAKYPTRILGLAINGVAPSNSTSPALGALRGYVTTDTGGFNEIDTTQPISLNEWTHVVFTRSTQTGMHIYVNGVEQNVTVTAGTQNPTGSIEQMTGLYMGHDSITTLENVQILNVATEPTTSTPILATMVVLDPSRRRFRNISGNSLLCEQEWHQTKTLQCPSLLKCLALHIGQVGIRKEPVSTTYQT